LTWSLSRADDQDLIGHVDAVLLSNSTWIDEDDPCVVFGMRGVLHASLEVSSGISDAHSGVDGGAVAEPMFDMVRVLGAIGGQDGIKLPHFCTSFHFLVTF
jgi:di- and tripeptidase